MSLDDATRAQNAAADPGRSAWLTANAGSGKTRVLTDRVTRLLFDGARPEGILCLTYTKAAASEMQNRLFKRLGEWAMLPDGKLVEELAKMGVAGPVDPERLRKARTLFARAIEAPGGLRVQTIHSFCAAILRRFPVEAGVSPAFREAEERATVILMDEVLDALAERDPGAVAGVARYLGGSDMRAMMMAVRGKRDAFGADLSRDDLCAALGLDPALTEARLLAETFTGGEAALCAKAAALLDPETRGNPAIIATLTGFPWEAPTLEDLARIEPVFLFGTNTKTNPDGPKIGSFANAGVRASLGDDLAPLEAFMERLAAARPRRRALEAVDRAMAVQRFARAWLPAYDDAKAQRGWLDFDDLIGSARALLTDPEVAPWVLFRLDGGIDHLLVDEAQDTSPPQWDIVRAIAEEFASGEGARQDTVRTLFVVGDRKQSIYSFQGADPEGFARMRDLFSERLASGPAPLGDHELVYSFRSAEPILALVDRVAESLGHVGFGDPAPHKAFRDKMPGRIDIWPPVPKSADPEERDWDDPLDMVADTHHDVVLAKRVADWIAELLRDPPLKADGNPVAPGDILILLRRRSGKLFPRLIEEIKAAHLPILGADRFTVTDQIGVKDLTALLSFLATPEDDLSLAAALRSPLFGWSEDDLFRLAHHRDAGAYLWTALRGSDATGTLAILRDLRDMSDYLRPFELLDRALTRHGMRRRLLARLGPEAEDGIDALLAQAMEYERAAVPSLTGFLEWLAADKLQIKRDSGGQAGQIRVMTVHGAKGLEAPVVILPETAVWRARSEQVRLLADGSGPVFWAGSKDDAPEPIRDGIAEAARKDAEERNRLLYVALTRAAEWLVVGAAGDLGKTDKDSWYGTIRKAAEEMGAVDMPMFGETGLRIETGHWRSGPAWTPPAEGAAALPDWTGRPPPTPVHRTARTPSDLGGAKVVPGDPGAQDEAAALRKGRLVHLLLEHLPGVAEPGWVAAAPGILSLDGPGVPEGAELDALLSEAAAVLTAPDLRPLFSADALAEVPVTGFSETLGAQVTGQIDRLIVGADRVLAVDFKTNAGVPDSAQATPEGLLRQMGAYAEILSKLYPDRAVTTAFLWTSAARLTELPHDLVMAALQRAAGD
ncbi:double-strand break repair helicase AddA [Rhodobacterales bacterium HKCCE3408]|nr:double-strand break repair helicase AddA [Rhodobacterales bacterium HKCCE3408]